MQLDDMMNVEDVAAYVGMTVDAVYQNRHRKLEPGTLGRRIGKRIYWRRSDIDRWIDGLFENPEVA